MRQSLSDVKSDNLPNRVFPSFRHPYVFKQLVHELGRFLQGRPNVRHHARLLPRHSDDSPHRHPYFLTSPRPCIPTAKDPILRQRPQRKSRNVSPQPLSSTPPNSRPPNSPNSPESFLPPRSLIHPRKSTSTTLWCVPNSSTYLILSTFPTPFPHVLSTLLQTALQIISYRLFHQGDGPVLAGGYSLDGDDGQALITWNTNNHQQTYGVLSAAVRALMDFMRENGVGEVVFSIYDGPNEVGAGVLGGDSALDRLMDDER